MRAIALAVLTLAGCTGSPSAPPPPPSADVVATSPTVRPAASTTPPPGPTPSPVVNGVYTTTDEAIAALLRAAAGEAIPRLKRVNGMDPGQLEDLFVSLGIWITDQRTGVQAYSPSGCTADAVATFTEALDAYDDIRKRFIAWRDWGAHGHAFHPEAPRQAAALFEEALLELTAHCTA